LDWNVQLLPDAIKELAEAPESLRRAAVDLIASFEEDPFPPDCLKLQGWNDLYRVRLEGWRIVYQINARRKTVLVWRVRPRAKAYLGLEPL
jgi:mRNA interferase RelE/StbE